MTQHTALITVGNHLVSPLDIKYVRPYAGHRAKWDYWDGNIKLWHPMINSYIDKLPWYQRAWVRRKYAVCARHASAHVEIKITGLGHWPVDIEFSSNRKANEYAVNMTNAWDQALAKFHGEIK